jgi:hypothetical protein
VSESNLKHVEVAHRQGPHRCRPPIPIFSLRLGSILKEKLDDLGEEENQEQQQGCVCHMCVWGGGRIREESHR